jgi:hypothetical protein
MPFGDNANDLPVEELQVHFNESLGRLMDPVVQSPPKFNYREGYHDLVEYKKMAAVENFFMDKQPASARRSFFGGIRKFGASGSRLSFGEKASLRSMNSSEGLYSSGIGSTQIQPKARETQKEQSAPVAESPPVVSPCARPVQETKLGAATGVSPREEWQASREEWQMLLRNSGRRAPNPFVRCDAEALDHEVVTNLTECVEEKLSKIVQELVNVVVPATCSRLAEASYLAQGFSHPSKPWLPASDATRFRTPFQTPEAELFQSTVFRETFASPDTEFREQFQITPINSQTRVVNEARDLHSTSGDVRIAM